MGGIYRAFTLKSLFRRRKEWIGRILICSLTITVLFLFAVFYASTKYSQYLEQQNIYGSYNFSIYQVSSVTSNFLKTNALVNKTGTMTVYGTVKAEYGQAEGYLGSIDDTAVDLIGIALEKGHFPVKHDEVALEKELLLQLGLTDTLGDKITLKFTDGQGYTEDITFTLCGVINSYHNSYLKQGPLVTALVCDYFSATKKYPIFNNNFISLKEGYISEDIMKELKSAASLKSSLQNEKWYYNTYIDMANEINPTFLWGILILCVVLASQIYHSYFCYYTYRFKKLSDIHIIALNKQKIFSLLFSEARTVLYFSLILGTVTGAIITAIVKLFVDTFLTTVHICISIKLILAFLLLGAITLAVSVMVSQLHFYISASKQTTLHLPSQANTVREFSDKKQFLHFIMRRFWYVYKKTVIYYLILYTACLTSIYTFVCLSTYYLDEVSYTKSQHISDYTIGSSPYSSDCKNENIEEIPRDVVDMVAKIDDIDMIIALRYFVDDSLSVIELSKDSQLNFLINPSTSREQEDTQSPQCILYLPAGYSDHPMKQLGHSPKAGDTIPISYNGQTYHVTISEILNQSDLITSDSIADSDTPKVYLDSTLYEKITSKTHNSPYNYISINYQASATATAVTNIIDSLIYVNSNQSEYTSHTVVDKNMKIRALMKHFSFFSTLCAFICLLSSSIQRNNHTQGLKGIYTQFRLLWSLGLGKKRMISRIYVSSLIMIFISMLFSIPLTSVILFFYYVSVRGDKAIHFLYFYTQPNIYLYATLFSVLFVVIHMLLTYKDTKKVFSNL